MCKKCGNDIFCYCGQNTQEKDANVILFKNVQYTDLIDLEALRKEYWSHDCPNIGMVSQPETVCVRCLKTRPKTKL